MAHCVVLGGGLGGIPMALELREMMRQETVTVISESDFFRFVPSNPWVAVGWRKPSDVVVSLPEVFRKKGIEFTSVGAQRVEPEANRVVLRDGSAIDYDYLVIATGPALAFDEVEGLGPAGHTHSICALDHAEAARSAWDAFCQDPGPIVVGAVQGASCFGPAYEFALIMDTDLRRRRIRDKVPMTFVTPEPYIGHLGLDGVGDTKGLLESLLRERHIRWITNARTDRVEAGMLHATEINEDGGEGKAHQLPFRYAMMLPAFRGVPALMGADGKGLPGLANPRGFVLVDEFQRNPAYGNVFSIGVAIAIPPLGPTPVPVGVPKTGYMIESMVTATARNIRCLLDGREPEAKASWNAICLADFGDKGVAFVAMPQIPPRNVNWASEGRWVHVAKIAFEKYFLHKVRRGVSEPVYEKYVLKLLGIGKLSGKGRTA